AKAISETDVAGFPMSFPQTLDEPLRFVRVGHRPCKAEKARLFYHDFGFPGGGETDVRGSVHRRMIPASRHLIDRLSENRRHAPRGVPKGCRRCQRLFFPERPCVPLPGRRTFTNRASTTPQGLAAAALPATGSGP